MTIQERFHRKRKWLAATILVGILLFMFSMLAVQRGVLPMPMLIATISPFLIVSMWGHVFAFRCPACRGNFGPFFMQNIMYRTEISYCPFLWTGFGQRTRTCE
jgi:hypothetical protein